MTSWETIDGMEPTGGVIGLCDPAFVVGADGRFDEPI